MNLNTQETVGCVVLVLVAFVIAFVIAALLVGGYYVADALVTELERAFAW